MNQAILLQPCIFLINVIFIPIYISFKDQYTYSGSSNPSYYRYSLFTLDYPTIILILHFTNIFLCFLNFKSKLNIISEGKADPENNVKLLDQSSNVLKDNDENEVKVEESDQVSSV